MGNFYDVAAKILGKLYSQQGTIKALVMAENGLSFPTTTMDQIILENLIKGKVGCKSLEITTRTTHFLYCNRIYNL
jgi:hypothetical protein